MGRGIDGFRASVGPGRMTMTNRLTAQSLSGRVSKYTAVVDDRATPITLPPAV
jgi:hypothetical protein